MILSLKVIIAVMMILLLCMVKVFYILSVVTGFYHFSFQLPLSGLGILADYHWLINCPATTTYLCWLLYSPSLDKEYYFVCLLTVAFLSTTVWVFSLPIFHGMHLIVPTHPYFFLAVCYPNRIFPPKELERQSQNRLFPLPTTRSYPLLFLTHDPPLFVLAGYRLVMFVPCACNISMYVQNLSATYAFVMVWRLVYAFCCSSLTSYGVNFFLISHSLQLAFFQGLGLI